MPVTISTPDGKPVSIKELAADADFIARPGGSYASKTFEVREMGVRIFMCTRCSFAHKSCQLVKEHIVECNEAYSERPVINMPTLGAFIREGAMTVENRVIKVVTNT
jgi:hypothetical protein